ncbi:MAG: alpha-2-macroglobulin family protein [Thermoanaerobaculia bacterium]
MRAPWRWVGAGMLLAALASFGGSAAPGPQKKKAAAAPAAPTATPTPVPPRTWKDVDRLVSEQKFEQALKGVEAILDAAKKRGDAPEWTKALIRATQLRMGLHGAETAVRFLKEEPWPPDLLSRAALELFYAQALVGYAQTYSWEVSQRERVESSGKVDLKAWTREQIYEEAARAYFELWKEREALGRYPVKSLSEFVEPNDYPEHIRGTLRDALSYFSVARLADTSGWSPAASNEIFRLDLAALLRQDAEAERTVRLDDAATHPLVKLVAVLADLEGWHAGRGEREASFEARLERLRRLQSSFAEEEDRATIQRDLAERLPAMADLPWFAMGKAQLAEFLEASPRPEALVRAHAVAEEGRRAYPDSVGGRRCLAIMKRIEAPDYQIRAMRTDAPERRSILVTHKNITPLKFRAFRLDLPARVAAARDLNKVLPTYEELREIVKGRPDAEWSVPLPETSDYRQHSTYVVPPMKAKGLYVVAASGASTFGGPGAPLEAATLLVSDLVLTMAQSALLAEDGGGVLEVRALSGATGWPIEGAAVSVYRGQWNPQSVERDATGTSDAEGFTRLRLPKSVQPWTYQRFLYARAGEDLALELNAPYWSPAQPETPATSSLVFTDRSIYRPTQKVLWKVLAYRGDAKEGRLRVFPQSPVTVALVDANNQTVASRAATTNEFGSAAGEFPIPTGRALGAWRVSSSLGGAAAVVRVEEYKRPTFEVKLEDPAEPLRLNRPARLTGETRYYFGLPVASGQVRWRVTRTPQYPWWFWWRGWGGGGVQTQTIDAGTSALQADGRFTLAFTPRADERRAAQRSGVTYSYTVAADVADEGGETQSASRSFRLGFVSVEARIEPPAGFVREREPVRIKVVRTNLDGVPRAGKASWRLVRLAQPRETLLPAEQPADPASEPGETDAKAFGTPGDLLRPRWQMEYAPERVMARWEDGAEVARGELAHDEKGEAWIPLAGLPAGAYRIRYRTADEFGGVFEAPREIVVAGTRTPLALPAILLAESNSVEVGKTARLLVASGLPGQPLLFEIDRDGRRVEGRRLQAGKSPELVEIPIGEKDRGGFAVKVTVLRDHQLVTLTQSIFVPWDDKKLAVSFASFRDRLRPGQRETWTVKVQAPGGRPVEPAAAELLAYMYDRSLEAFVPHNPPDPLALYPNRAAPAWERSSLAETFFAAIAERFPDLPSAPYLRPDSLKLYGGYGIGGPGRRGLAAMDAMAVSANVTVSSEAPASAGLVAKAPGKAVAREAKEVAAAAPADAPVALRSNFAETAFWKPQLLTGTDGSASIEFTVPDSVTSWNVFVHAVTKDLKAGSVRKEARSVKELMVRPYVPRFLREGDAAELKIVVNNASERGLSGQVTLDILDTETNESALSRFGLTPERARQPFSTAARGGADVTFRLTTPSRVGSYAIKATAVSGDFSDGELRPVPVLPGRMQLAQSRFAALRGGERRTLTFEDMAKDDSTRIDELLVVTVDAQLFYSVLSALPYLVNYPYECTEQTLNRFVSTGIVSSVFRDFPAVAKMAEELSKRDTRLEIWDAMDPNRKMALEETPWLEEARGGGKPGGDLVRILDPRIAAADREAALAKLRKAQTESGGFPWWPGGPPSPYMTLYILHGFANALEFGVEVPKDMIQRAWAYAGEYVRHDLALCMHGLGLCELATFVNYTLSSYPDESWYAPAFDAAYRKYLLNYSFGYWKVHPPYLKGQLALTLKRMARPKDAKLVWDSVMDAAKTDRDLGTYFAPEDRAWLWYNDTVETQAFALRVLAELSPSDSRREGLVQWLFLNKKLNHWKSTRATAEAISSLVWYLKKEGALAVREGVEVQAGGQTTSFDFEPDRYTGKRNQVVIPGEKLDPKRDAQIVVAKTGKGLAFTSATWHFSTEKLPEEDRGDFFKVSRKYFLRDATASGFVLKPLAEGTPVKSGDQIEVQISLSAKHAAEYVHLRDPRPAGAEPENVLSRYKWDLGISWYEETRDSGSNFFFEWLPAGEYTFKYRIRANMAGTFKVAPATVQPMYAPEFNAYSAGATITIQ